MKRDVNYITDKVVKPIEEEPKKTLRTNHCLFLNLNQNAWYLKDQNNGINSIVFVCITGLQR